MIKNILVGYKSSRAARVALAQAIDLAEACLGRVHLLVASPEPGPMPEAELPSEPGVLQMVDSAEDAPELEHEGPVIPPFVDEARLKLHEAHVAGSIRVIVGGQASVCLREESHLADLVVIGRSGRPARGGQVGRTSRRLLQRRLRRPLLICTSEYTEPKSILLLYEFCPAGGRAVSVAGELATTLNIDLDVVVTTNKRYGAERQRKRVESALLAYHTEGDVISAVGSAEEALLTEGLQRNPSIVVIAQPPAPLWSWQFSPLYTTALELPATMILVVP